MKKQKTVEMARAEGSAEVEKSRAAQAELLRQFESVDFASMADWDKAKLAGFYFAMKRENGGFTPFEHFLDDLAADLACGRLPDSTFIADRFEDFQDNFAFMFDATRDFMRAYPNAAGPLNDAERPAETPGAETAPEYTYQIDVFDEAIGGAIESVEITAAEYGELRLLLPRFVHAAAALPLKKGFWRPI